MTKDPTQHHITEIDIAKDFQQLLSNPLQQLITTPTTPSSVKSVSPSVPSVLFPRILSAISQNDIQADFQTLVSVQSVQSSVKSVFVGQHSLSSFANWLKAQKLSRVSIKNYLSDIRQFLSWLSSTHPTTPLSQLNSEICHQYLNSLQPSTNTEHVSGEINQFVRVLGQANGLAGASTKATGANNTIAAEQIAIDRPQLTSTFPTKATINRKLASLRKYALFLGLNISISNLPPDPTHQLLKSFKAHLVKKRHSPKTITNYLSDLRHYLNWAIKNGHTVVTSSHAIVTHRQQGVTMNDDPQSGASDHE